MLLNKFLNNAFSISKSQIHKTNLIKMSSDFARKRHFFLTLLKNLTNDLFLFQFQIKRHSKSLQRSIRGIRLERS